MKKDWSTIEVLRHARHDWLNKIQLLKGNLALNKIDRAKEIIDEIVVEAQQESKLSNLKIPQFASLLLTCNWENHSFQLEYDILEEHSKQLLNDELLTEWTSALFECLDSSIKLFHDNHLSITIEPLQERTRFFFDFSGIIMESERIAQFLQSSALKVEIQEFTETELTFEVIVPTVGE